MFLEKIAVRGFRAGAGGTIECTLPGRFSVLVGANGAGKSTIAEAIYWAHPRRFPTLPRPSSETLSSNPSRSIDLEYVFNRSGDESALGAALRFAAQPAPQWSRALERDLGRMRVASTGDALPEAVEAVRAIYLPAYRNPVDELGRREATILVELLRAQQLARSGTRSLHALRAEADKLLAQLRGSGLLAEVEDRIADHLSALSSGVEAQFAFLGGRAVDDRFLARVFELLLATVDNRLLARQLEVSGLGFVNLLHIAVTLAAIPDSSLPRSKGDGPVSGLDEQALDDEAAAYEDSFFPDDFHVVVVIEEPEAHLHPQLQHSLCSYLRQVVADRPEIQVILSTHSGELVAACDPAELVFVGQASATHRVAWPIASAPIRNLERTLRMTRMHLDAMRSAALFASAILIVEGVTDVVLIRELGRSWAAEDEDKLRFVETLTVMPMGTRVGRWPVDLLACPGFEISRRAAVLTDSDVRPPRSYNPPAWHTEYDPDRVGVFYSDPTLEPFVTKGNEEAVSVALSEVFGKAPESVDAYAVDVYFSGDSGRRRKAEYALELASELRRRREAGTPAFVNDELARMFEYLFEVRRLDAFVSAE